MIAAGRITSETTPSSYASAISSSGLCTVVPSVRCTSGTPSLLSYRRSRIADFRLRDAS